MVHTEVTVYLAPCSKRQRKDESASAENLCITTGVVCTYGHKAHITSLHIITVKFSKPRTHIIHSITISTPVLALIFKTEICSPVYNTIASLIIGKLMLMVLLYI
ncbi:hypothetical protein CEXT_230631 [Caerostris extrusa]|uniref:Uncharacterized protein n=1 Tax=Caerostris extrusa TaxID=172846 RepID=A0AAV4U9P0_CAEEX|nr:hypothetical protein CEXT_230631 [Caerostris extrusa]